jgi:hypothetical protein
MIYIGMQPIPLKPNIDIVSRWILFIVRCNSPLVSFVDLPCLNGS